MNSVPYVPAHATIAVLEVAGVSAETTALLTAAAAAIWVTIQ